MKLGVIFPQQEIGADPGGLREYFQAVEDLGYDYVGVYDHVLGADTCTNRPNWTGIYNKDDMFHEAFVLLAYRCCPHHPHPALHLHNGHRSAPDRPRCQAGRQPSTSSATAVCA